MHGKLSKYIFYETINPSNGYLVDRISANLIMPMITV